MKHDVWFIIASGPSLTSEDVDAVKGKGKVVAVNNAIFKAPWADTLYACDHGWWKQYNPKWFDGEKLTLTRYGYRYGAKTIPNEGKKRGFGRTAVTIGGPWSNGGFHMLNWAVIHHVPVVALLGFDHQHTNGKRHYHEDHPKGMGNAATVEHWVKNMEFASHDTRDTTVINCSRETALTCFKRMTIQEFLSEYCTPASISESA